MRLDIDLKARAEFARASRDVDNKNHPMSRITPNVFYVFPSLESILSTSSLWKVIYFEAFVFSFQLTLSNLGNPFFTISL